MKGLVRTTVVAIIGLLMIAVILLMLPLMGLFMGSANAACSNGPATSGAAGGTVPSNAGLFTAIFIKTRQDNRLTVAMLTGSHLESGWSNSSVGVGSYGPYQIQHPGVVHPDITVAQAMDPAYSTNYMFGAYQAGLNNVNPALWTSNPVAAAEQTAYNAERPASIYHQTQGQAKVNSAFAASIQVMKQHGISTNFGKGSTPSGLPNLGDFKQPSCDVAGLFAGETGGPQAKTVLLAAKSQLGVPYVWGGTTPKSATSSGGLDCSGLTQWAFARIGINLPRTAAMQWQATIKFTVAGSTNDYGKIAPGDLVFFTGADGSRSHPGHIGIYVGNGIMINAPRTGQNVKYEDIRSSYWKSTFISASDPFAWAASIKQVSQ